ncbi:MAG: hypothetical protein SGPRY_006704 [Prymnesium sp.]
MSAVVQDWFYRTFYKWGKTVAHSPKKVIGISFFVAVLCCIRLLIAPAQPLPSETRQEKLFAPQDSRVAPSPNPLTPSLPFLAKPGFVARVSRTTSATRHRSVLACGGTRCTSPPSHAGATCSPQQCLRKLNASTKSFGLSCTCARTRHAPPHALACCGEPHQQRRETTTSGNARICAAPCSDRNLHLCPLQGRDDDEWTEGNVTFSDICVRLLCALLVRDPLELFAWANGTYSFGFTDAEVGPPRCGRGEPKCQGLVHFSGRCAPLQILDIVNSRVGIDPALFPAAANRTVNVDSVFGGIERDGSGRITSAEAISLSYTLNNDERDSIEDKQGFAWEEQLNYMIGPEWTDNPPDNTRGAAYPEEVLSFSSTEVDLFPFTHGAINREFANSVSGDILTLNIDDMFVLISSLENIPEGLPVEEVGPPAHCLNTSGALPAHALRQLPSSNLDTVHTQRVAQGIASAGVSITITSLTDFLAFLLGSTSSLPALSAFCVFAAIGILADFILQITLFAAFMTLDAYREDRGTSDCCCCPCVPKDASEEGAGCCTWYPQLQTLNERYYVPLLRNRFVKAIVLVSFFTFTGIAGWQIQLETPLLQAFIVSDDYFTNTGNGGVRVNIVGPPSTVFDYSLPASQQKMIEMSQAVAASKWMVGASVTPWYQPLRAWVYQCVSTHTLPDTSTCVGRNCASNGVLLFPHCTSKRYLRDAGGDFLLDANGQPISEGADNKTMVTADGTSAPIDTPVEQTYLPPSSFYSYLNQFLFDSPTGGVFTSSFRWVVPNVGNISSSEVEQGLEASQFRITSLYLDTANEQVDSMDDLRKTVESVGIGPDISSYPYTFVYIFYEQVQPEGDAGRGARRCLSVLESWAEERQRACSN